MIARSSLLAATRGSPQQGPHWPGLRPGPLGLRSRRDPRGSPPGQAPIPKGRKGGARWNLLGFIFLPALFPVSPLRLPACRPESQPEILKDAPPCLVPIEPFQLPRKVWVKGPNQDAGRVGPGGGCQGHLQPDWKKGQIRKGRWKCGNSSSSLSLSLPPRAAAPPGRGGAGAV